MNKKEDGFTLIELMAVIIIIGALAAVAAPKLFGHLAKAKASEIYGAAGAYINLQDTYNTEFPDSIGTWGKIGYKMQTTNNFRYLEENVEGGKKTEGTVALTSGKLGAWQALSRVGLNSCTIGSTWQVDALPSNTEAYRILYKVNVTGGAHGECAILTTNFAALSTLNRIEAPQGN